MAFSSFFRGLPFTLAFISSLLDAASGQDAGSGAKYGTVGSPVEIPLWNFNNEGYSTEIILGGQKVKVLVDTGSTDLWIDPKGLDVKYSNTTDVKAGLVYGIGEVEGTIAFADVQIGPYFVPNQAFLNASKYNPMPDGIVGLIGLAFDGLAAIPATLAQTWGKEAALELGLGTITNVIAQDRFKPGYFDLHLGRTDENNTDHDPHFLIGQHAPGFEAVTSAPKLERVDDRHWTVALDGVTINGKAFEFNKSAVAGVPAGKVGATFDSGYTTSVFPDALIDAIYSSIPGAVKYTNAIPGTDNPAGNNWILPCNASTNLTFILGGQEFPIHPRDTFAVYPGIKLDTIEGVDLLANTTICLNRFFSGEPDETFDILLGMGVLRNVYASHQYGDYTPGVNLTSSQQQPYLQLLSTTQRDAAWAEFNAYTTAKLASAPPASDPASIVKFLMLYAESQPSQNHMSTDSGASTSAAATPVSQTSVASAAPSPTNAAPSAKVDAAQDLAVAGAVSSSSDSESDADKNKYGPVALGLLGANLVLALAVLGVTLTMCIRGGKERREARYKPIRLPKEQVRSDDVDDVESSGARYSD
ncbi:aspartic peptidase domain-containing protein [Trametes polyzona]|nr:aspartic peptidase domain-containing protein [Trametes polyzona]